MKQVLLSGVALVALAVSSASAADLPRKAPPPVVVAPPFSWSGFYIGGHVGGAKVERCLELTLLDAEACVDRTGWLGGGQIGYNWQAGQLVFGVEFSGSFADLGGGVNAGLLPGGMYFESDGKSLLMLTGRLGWAMDRTLLYVTGGAASARANVDFHVPVGAAIVVRDASLTRTGWTFGIGAEFAFTPNWSFAAQYNWIDLGGRDVTFAALGAAPLVAANVDQSFNVFTLRMNYRFGGYAAPVAARY
jgi:outer membrane immunogenic protein